MKITRHQNARSFLDRTRRMLEADESLNNLLLGLAGGLEKLEDPDPEKYFFLDIANDKGDPVFAALRSTLPTAVIFGAPGKWEDFAPMVLPILRGMDPHLKGLNGIKDQVLSIVLHHDLPYTVEDDMGFYELTQLVGPRPAPGKPRLAREEDIRLCAEWMAAFNEEAFSFQVSAEKLVPRLERIVAKDAAWVWEDGGKLTSMAHIVRRTRHVSGIGYVYTPHELRGKGYASQVTAAATRAELDHGKDMCVLFTDLNNPTSNRIYQRIGYRKVAEFIRISFDETGEG